MNRKSFLKTLFTGLVATRLAFQLGAAEVDRNLRNKRAIEEIKKFFEMESGRISQDIFDRMIKSDYQKFLEYPKTSGVP